jgi:L-ascorbate metabolism protein UlaG (beta-lactamase superfamily)
MELFAPVDYALLPIDGKMVMEPADAIRAGHFLQARTLIPMHWREEDPKAFAESARAAGFESFVMTLGQTVELTHSS